jgi:hypothetical protein
MMRVSSLVSAANVVSSSSMAFPSRACANRLAYTCDFGSSTRCRGTLLWHSIIKRLRLGRS